MTANLGLARLRLKGLDEQALYELDGKTYYGSDLMYAGLPIHNEVHVQKDKDFSSRLYILKRINES